MAALTLDHLSGGRHILGLGVSGPQVVEGWYGQPFGKPLARTREYVGIIRQVLAREAPVTNDGPHYPLPYTGPNSLGLGKPLRPIVHPLRADLPIYLGTEGPKNVALTAEIAEGFARPGARQTAATFEIATNCQVTVTDDPEGIVQMSKPMLGFYIGGMGAKDMNFHKDVFSRMGYEKEADEIQRLFLEGKRDEAIALVPDEAVADISLIGSEAAIRDRLPEWEEAGVTTLVISAQSIEQIRQVAEVVLGA
jgi:alkanesulfonate monooxygenase SsuD/methylene tetrahydromethanopterin reductase-like flavin-dependent oxidoreductase (luciferase family)